MLSVPCMSSRSCYTVARAGYIYNLLLSNFPVKTSPKTAILELKVLRISFNCATSKRLAYLGYLEKVVTVLC